MIEIDDLYFSYDGKNSIIEHASASIPSGAFVGIFGPNGGGKTTLLKLLLGLLQPTQGVISINGKAPEEVRNQMGYVPQTARFDKQFPITVLDLVLLGCLGTSKWWGGIPKETLKRAHMLLECVNLSGFIHAPFGALSGGQAQRALIAKALLKNPDILLLDEPTASVDVCAEKDIYNILDDLKGKMTILMVTHDLASILHKADRFLCVHRHVDAVQHSEVCQHYALGLYHTPLGTKR